MFQFKAFRQLGFYSDILALGKRDPYFPDTLRAVDINDPSLPILMMPHQVFGLVMEVKLIDEALHTSQCLADVIHSQIPQWNIQCILAHNGSSTELLHQSLTMR